MAALPTRTPENPLSRFMPKEAFNQTLQRELEEFGDDYNIPSFPQQFALWVGAIVFGLEPREVIDNRILWSDETLCVFLADEVTEHRLVLAVCEFVLDPRDEFDPAQLLSRWERGRTDSSSLTAAGADLSDAQNESPAFEVTHLFFTTREIASTAFGSDEHVVYGRVDLDLRYARLKDPGGVTEPASLEVSPWDHGDVGQDLGDPTDPSAVRAYVQMLPLALIHEWVKQYRNGLFASNLRYRLSGTGDAAALELDHAIRRTVREHPQRMLIQNNGVTITCERIETSSEGTTATLIRPQIVNGCQTSWAIFDEVKEFLARGKPAPDGRVVAKIIETADESLAATITTASNKQNAIQPRDERGRDPRHGKIAEVFAHHAPNRRIHWDYRRGAIANLRDKPSGQEYLVPGTRGLLRTIDNVLGGQIVLAMAGAVHEAKHKPGELFNPRSRSYDIAFGFDYDPDRRFGNLAATAFLRSGGVDDVTTYAEDVLFGFVVYQHALAAFKSLHAETVRLFKKDATMTDAERETALSVKAQHDFVKFWTFDVVRLIHRIAEAWVELYGRSRQDVRLGLVGDLTVPKYLDPPFRPLSIRPTLFRPDRRPNSPAVLELANPSTTLGVLGKWFVSLEELGAEVIEEAKRADRSASTRLLVLSRPSTYEALSAALETSISGHRFVRQFPDPTTGA